VGSFENGKSEIIHGIPPTFAHNYTKILLQIDRIPFEKSVLVKTTWLGTPF